MEELTLALNTTTASGQALLPEDLEPAIVEYLARQMPLFNFVDRGQADSKTHEFTRRTAVPAAWVEGETTPSAVQSSTYDRKTVQLKILRTWGSVSGFQQRQSQRFMNALSSEISGSIEGLADLFEYSMLWGDDTDAYQFSGVNTYITEDKPANIFDLNAAITLTDLDNMIDATEVYRGTNRDPKIFIASQNMISRLSGLQTKIQRTVQQIEYEGGFRLDSYRGIPLLPSNFVQPATTTTSPDVTATAAAGGSLADDEYFYRIASVTMYGEQLIGGEDSATTATTNNSVTLSWTADANAKLYKVYRGTVTGADNLTLLATIAAKSYDSAGTLSTNVASWTDDGSNSLVSQVVPLSTGEECIFLANLNPDRGMQLVGNMSPIGDMIDTFVTYAPLATTKSSFDYMIESFAALKVPYAEVHSVSRRARLA